MVAANRLSVSNRKSFKWFDSAFWIFTLSVLLLPLGLGGNRAIPFGFMQAGLAICCVYLALGRREWSPPKIFTRLRVALAMFLFVVIWAFLQTQSFMPTGWTHPVWKEAGTVLNQNLPGAISLSPEESIMGLNRLITYIVVGLLGFFFAQDHKRARQMMSALWISGTIVCTYGLLEYISGGHRILWFKKWAYQEDLTACFVNRNHFAIYAGMVLTAGAALVVQTWRESVLAEKKHLRARAMREWLVRHGAMRIFSLMLILLCIVLSHSRAGLVLSLGGLGSYLFFYQIYRKEYLRATIVAFGVFIMLALIILAALQYSDRFATLFTDYSSTDRLKVYRMSMEAAKDNPFLGYGLDSFQSVFRLYQRSMIMEFEHAHSDVLESVLDLGMPAAFMLWTAIGLCITGLVHGITNRRRYGMYAVMGLAASVMVIGHSLVDFSMQIPGVVVPWAMLVGAGLGQSWRSSEKEPKHESWGR